MQTKEKRSVGKVFMMQRIRIKGKSIGQIDEDLLRLYMKKYPQLKVTTQMEQLIETQILHRPVKSIEDLDLAEQYVKNLYYRNIGEFLDAYIKDQVYYELPICENCTHYNRFCDKKKNYVHRLEKACEKYELKTDTLQIQTYR